MATHNIHVPRVPNPKFRGESHCGVRGDTIVEFDWTAGQVLDALDRLKLADNTLVILTSDNGGILDNNGPDIVHGSARPRPTTATFSTASCAAPRARSGKAAPACR